MYKFSLIVFVLLCAFMANAQYISGVTYPDTTKRIVNDATIPAIRYAHSIKADELRNHLTILASDSLEGRETGQPGIDLAADYISKFLRNLGMKTMPNSASYLQPVAFTYSKWSNLEFVANNEKYRHLWDFLAFPDRNNSLPSLSETEVLFLGYGIDDALYSDYKDKDVKGKVIMINRGEPLNKDSISYVSGTTTPSAWSDADLEQKLKTAKEKGVKLVLIIENDIKKLLEENRRKLLGNYLELGNKTLTPIEDVNHIYISSTIAKSIIGTNEKDVLKARKKMAKGKSEAVTLSTILSIKLAKETTVLEGNNIVGYVEGKTKKDEIIVVSAHYDHLGKRGDEVFNGADDNGSGTSTVMELAQAVMQSTIEGNTPERSIAFVWFCGEEKGLLGSLYYAQNPIFPLDQTVANVNIDMVGRIDDTYKNNPNYVYVIGSDRLSTDLHSINEEVNQKYSQLTLDYTYNSENDPNNYYYRSDHYNFAKNGIPSIFFFNGTHTDYHRTTDDIEKINFDIMANRGKHIFHVIWELANRANRIVVDGEIK
jgi:Peptidase family M28